MGLLNNANVADSVPKQRTGGASRVAHLTLMKKPASGSDAAADERGKRILIIEDESGVRTLLEHMFILEGYETTLAEDGNEGVVSFREIRHDLVFTDLHLPGISGTEVARSIKAMSPNTPVIAVTGWGTTLSDVDTSLQTFDFIVSKPFDLEQLLEMASGLTAKD